MSEIASFNRPPRVDANFQSRMVLLKCGPGSLKDCGDENANNEIPQQSQTFNLESDPNPKNIRADDFGSEGSSSEESFDAEVFDNTFETASVNSQLSALDELDELEIDDVNLVDENVDKRKDVSPVNENQNAPGAEIESATLLQQQNMYTTKVYVSLKTENKAEGKTGKIRCRVPSRDDALGTRNSACSLSTNSLASETGSESSTTFQGPGDKSHEVKVQRVSLTSLPGLDMPDFIRASMEASLEKMELRDDKEEGDEVEGNEEAVAVTQSAVESPPVPKETKSPAIRAKFRPRKKSPVVRRRGSKPQELDGLEKEKQEGKSPQGPTRKSPGVRTRRKEPEVRPRGSRHQKANLENIKITESQIVMVVTNDQKSTFPSTKMPVLKSSSGEHTASTNEPKTETLQATTQTLFSQENEDVQFVLKQDENVLPSKIENEESSVESAAAPVVLPTEKKRKIPLPLNDSMKSAAVYKTEKEDDVQRKGIASPKDDRKSKIPLPATRQLSLEDKKDAEAPPKFESSTDVNENKTQVDPRNQAFDFPLSQNDAKTEGQSAPNDPVTKPTSPSEKQSKIPFPFACSTISESEENTKEVVVVQSPVNVATPTEKSSKIPLRAKLKQLETQAWLTRDSSSAAEEVRSDFEAMTSKEGSIEETEELVVAKSPISMTSSTAKVSKIHVFSKLGQFDYQISSNENDSSAKILSSLGMSSDRADTSRIETRSTAPLVSSSEQASSDFKALIVAPGEEKEKSITTKNDKSETVTAVEDAHSNETNSVSGEIISSSERKSKIPLPPCSKELRNTLSSSEDKNVKLLNSEKNKIPSIETENKTLSLHNKSKTPSQVGTNEGQPPDNSNEGSRHISPTERESRIPLPTNGQQCQNTVSLKNEEPNVLKSQVSSPTERKGKIPQSRIPMPRSPATSLPISPEDKKDIWIKYENNDGGEDSYVLHSSLATSTLAKVSIQPSKLPMATSRLPVRKNEDEEFEDMYDFDKEDGGQTLLQRYMMSEDRRVEEIIRHQKFQS